MIEDINKCLKTLGEGGIIIYPTDTVWGIGCDATRAEAVERIIRLKGRRSDKSLIVLVDSEGMLQRYVKEVPYIAWDLLDQVETPLTIIYPGGINLAPGVLANDGSVGIRIVRDDFCMELIRRFNKPIVSTSANFSGEPSPKSFGMITTDLLVSADYVVNWQSKTSTPSRPSSIIKLSLNGEIELIRQ